MKYLVELKHKRSEMKGVKEFISGFVVALVTFNDIYDMPSACADVIRSCGFDKEDFSHIKGYDKEKLKKIWKEFKPVAINTEGER
jgi:hypothetical protein